MKSTYLTIIVFVALAVVAGALLFDTLSTSSSQPTTTVDQPHLQTGSPEATSATQKPDKQTPATSTQVSSSSSATPSDSTFSTVNSDEATHIEITNSCDHNYQGGCLNVRAEPSTSSDIVEQLRNHIVLKVASVEQQDGRTWYQIEFDEWLRYPNRVAGDWWVAGDFVRPLQAEATATDTPEKIETKKRIVVDLSEQQLYAYDGDELFMKEAVSTGKPLYPTPRGTFPIYKMTPTRYMQGPIQGITDQKYDLPGVPWDLYFTYQGAVIHGAYWHNNFGTTWSNGCVNLPPAKAEQLYRWAELGTKVIVQD